MLAIRTMNDPFDVDLSHILPRLRIYALSLTRNRDHADDLVQQTAMKALAGRKSFRRGTNFGGWIFRIQRNEFISGLRRASRTVNIEDKDAYVPAEAPRQEAGLVMRDFVGAFRKIPKASRHAILLSQLEGFSHLQIADHMGVAQGTVKSRISRGRASLDRLLAA